MKAGEGARVGFNRSVDLHHRSNVPRGFFERFLSQEERDIVMAELRERDLWLTTPANQRPLWDDGSSPPVSASKPVALAVTMVMVLRQELAAQSVQDRLDFDAILREALHHGGD